MSDISSEPEGPVEEPQVGYGHPPLHSRFQPGHSGNPKGRPRGRRKLESVLNEVLGERMWGTVNGKRRRVSVEQAILLRLREHALKGDLKAATMLLNLRRASQSEDPASAVSEVMSDEDYAILANAGFVNPVGGAHDGS